MRVCDGSCRRLTRLQRQSTDHAPLIRELEAQAEACAQAGNSEWSTLMRRAATALRRTAETCCPAPDA
jgi:hypothetical protein